MEPQEKSIFLSDKGQERVTWWQKTFLAIFTLTKPNINEKTILFNLGRFNRDKKTWCSIPPSHHPWKQMACSSFCSGCCQWSRAGSWSGIPHLVKAGGSDLLPIQGRVDEAVRDPSFPLQLEQAVLWLFYVLCSIWQWSCQWGPVSGIPQGAV